MYKVNIVFYRIHRSHRLGVPGEDMKQDIRSIIRIILIFIMIGSLVWLGVIQWGNQRTELGAGNHHSTGSQVLGR